MFRDALLHTVASQKAFSSSQLVFLCGVSYVLDVPALVVGVLWQRENSKDQTIPLHNDGLEEFLFNWERVDKSRHDVQHWHIKAMVLK